MPRLDEARDRFTRSLKLRSISEIMDASDLIYRLNWAVRQYGASLDLDDGVVQERLHASALFIKIRRPAKTETNCLFFGRSASVFEEK